MFVVACLFIHLLIYLFFDLQIFQEAIREDWNKIQGLGYGNNKQQLLNQRVAEFTRNGNKFEGSVYEDRLLINTYFVCIDKCIFAIALVHGK